MKIIYIIWLGLRAAILTEHSQSDSTNEMEQETSLLLELHNIYCGDDFLCKNDSSYWDPAQSLIPVPCCVPCSCLPTCGNQMECCPALWENETVENWKHEDGTSRTEQNQMDIIDDVNARAADEPEEIIGDISSKKLRPRTDCIRPQALYKLNTYLDSEAYEMVTTCPVSFRDLTTIEKCHAGMENDNFLDMIPIQSSQTGLTYANKYCLDCNRVYENVTSKFRDWQPVLVGFGKRFLYKSFLRPEFIIKDLLSVSSGFENIHFIPDKAAVAPGRCKTYDITFCNQTGLQDAYNKTMENICRNGPGMPIIQDVDSGGLFSGRILFKNIACLLCNLEKYSNGNLDSCGYFDDLQPLLSSIELKLKYSLSFNLNNPMNNDMEESTSPPNYLGESSLRLLKQGICEPGYAELQGVCRKVICPRYHYLRENQCVPLFDTLSGLELNVKIQVTPDREIGDNIAPEFERKLTDMVKHIWKMSVSLRVRDIFVMYLLNKQRNRKIYYVFNTFLYSSTGEIRFNEAIKDTKSLFTEMKRQKMLPLSNGINVGLKTEFAHKISAIQRSFVDLSNGKPLIVMKKLAWEQRTRRPVFEISETYWCYRVGFSLKEIKFTGIKIIKINPSVTVYSTEFDFDIHTENIFICIDLLVTPINTEDIRPARDSEADSDNVIVEVNDESGVVIGTVVVCLVVVFVLCVIFCIVGVVAKRKTNTGLPAEQSTNRFDTNTDQLPEQIEINMRHDLPTALSLDKRNDELGPNLSVNNKTKGLQHGTHLKNPNTLDMTINQSKLVDKTFVDQSFEAQSDDLSKSIAYNTFITTIAFTKRDDKCCVTRERNPNPKQTTTVNGSNPTDDRLCMTDNKTNDDSNNKSRSDDNPIDHSGQNVTDNNQR